MNDYDDGDHAAATDAARFHIILSNDPDYLLRCALTFGWDAMIQFCNYLGEMKLRIITNSSDASKEAQARRAKKQLQACDQYGNSVLQSACFYRPPAQVVRALVRALRAWNVLRDVLLNCRANDQSTALQVACATGAGVEVVRLLLEAVVAAVAEDGAQENDFSLLVHEYVTHADQQGATPLSELVVWYTLQQKSVQHSATSRPLEQITNIQQECQRSPLLFAPFWAQVELLVQAATPSNPQHEESSFSILHAAASIASTCPAILTDLIVRCCSNQDMDTMSIQRPVPGWLPLHLAISNSAIIGARNVTKNLPNKQQHRILRQQQCYFFDCLLRRFPEAAGIPLPWGGRSPLCHAIVNCCDWHDFDQCFGRGVRARHHQQQQQGNHHRHLLERRLDQGYGGGVLERLWKLAPHTVGQRDAETGLYPFQLAACNKSNENKNNNNNNNNKDDENDCRQSDCQQQEFRQLDTIYNLLRVHPSAVVANGKAINSKTRHELRTTDIH